MAAIAWSYAGCVPLDLPLDIVFHPDGRRRSMIYAGTRSHYEVACADMDEEITARLLANLAGEVARCLRREARELEALDGRI